MLVADLDGGADICAVGETAKLLNLERQKMVLGLVPMPSDAAMPKMK
jgi:hypothetical protein